MSAVERLPGSPEHSRGNPDTTASQRDRIRGGASPSARAIDNAVATREAARDRRIGTVPDVRALDFRRKSGAESRSADQRNRMTTR
ncbi:hypothetical protein GPU89_38305 [Burkholderia cepacia]|nr:hypothetical protein [Burkholderia cepacia]